MVRWTKVSPGGLCCPPSWLMFVSALPLASAISRIWESGVESRGKGRRGTLHVLPLCPQPALPRGVLTPSNCKSWGSGPGRQQPTAPVPGKGANPLRFMLGGTGTPPPCERMWPSGLAHCGCSVPSQESDRPCFLTPALPFLQSPPNEWLRSSLMEAKIPKTYLLSEQVNK